MPILVSILILLIGSWFIKAPSRSSFWPIILLFSFFFTIAYLCIPFSVHLRNDTEIFHPYANYIGSLMIPGIHNQDYNNFSVVFILGYFIKKFTDVDASLILYFFRIFFFIFLSFAYLDLALKLSRKIINIPKQRNIFILLAVFFFIFDWNTSYLLIGDQYRNFLAQVFFIYFLSALIEERPKKLLFYGILSIATHWAYLLLLILSLSTYLFAKKCNIRRYVFIFLPAIAIMCGYLYKEIFLYLYRDHYEYINASHVRLGILDGLLLRPGVLLALLIHLFSLAAIWYKLNEINKNVFLKFCVLMFLFLFGLSKFAVVLSSNFIEPNRFYMVFSPLLAIVLTFAIYEISYRRMHIIVFSYFIINFVFRNFAKETIPFWEIVTKNDFIILKNFIIENHYLNWAIASLFLLCIYLGYFIKKHQNREELLLPKRFSL